MKRFQKLILDWEATEGVTALGRRLGIPKQSLSNYLLNGTEPRVLNLEKMSKFFNEPVAALLSEVGDEDSTENQMIDAMFKLTKAKKKAVLEFMRSL